MESSLPQTFKALLSQGPGKAPQVEFIPLPKPGKNQVIVKMEFAPINPSDIATMYGGYRTPSGDKKALVGFEGSGTIVAVGEDLLIQHQVGDKVHCSGIGTMAEYLVANSENCSKIQGDLSFEHAACHFVNPGTVYYMGYLVEKGGHKAAIHTAGTSALGRMLIRYFKHKGIKLINIVRRDDYNEELTKLGADYILNSQAPDFEAKLKEIAEKENATISFDAISGDFPAKLIHAQPPGSICYVYGALSGEREVKAVSILDLFKGKQLAGLYLTNFVDQMAKTGEITKVFAEIHSLLPSIFKSEIQKVFTLDNIQEALAYYNQNSSKGKILLKPN